MQRVAIIGTPGAGKSTLARRLSEVTGLTVIHLDARYWRPGWVEPDPERWAAEQAEMVQAERWIIDGNYSRTLEFRLARADTVVYLEVPRLVAIWRVIKRGLRYHGRHRPDMAAGCLERIDLQFLRWIWDYPRRSRPRTLTLLAEFEADGGRVVRLRSSGDVRAFLETVRSEVTLAAT